MKALYVPLTLLAVILTFSLWAGRYVDQRTEETIALLEQAGEAGLQEDWEAAAESLTQASTVWRPGRTSSTPSSSTTSWTRRRASSPGQRPPAGRRTRRSSTSCWPSWSASWSTWRRPRRSICGISCRPRPVYHDIGGFATGSCPAFTVTAKTDPSAPERGCAPPPGMVYCPRSKEGRSAYAAGHRHR